MYPDAQRGEYISKQTVTEIQRYYKCWREKVCLKQRNNLRCNLMLIIYIVRTVNTDNYRIVWKTLKILMNTDIYVFI